MKQTIAFNNSANYWKTRYSYSPSCMMYLNKLFFSSPQEKITNDGNQMIWRHNDSSTGFNSFYSSSSTVMHSGPSGVGISFNGYKSNRMGGSSNSSSSHKLFKAFSAQGNNQTLSIGLSNFKVNNNSGFNFTNDIHRFRPLVRRGNAMYGEIGREEAVTGTNIKAIGRIKNVYQWYSYLDDEEINRWRWLTTGDETAAFENISGLHIDDEGFDTPPTIGDRLYAFEIEYFMSNHPIPASINGGDPGQYVKLFSGKVNLDGDMQSIPYRVTDPQTYTPNTGHYAVNFEESPDFAAGDNYGTYLSYGDPYSDEYNTFKKGNFLMVRVNTSINSPHLRYERTPGCNSSADILGQYDFSNSISSDEDDLVYNQREVLFAMTPGEVNGADAHGTFADAFIVFNNSDFEVTSFNVEYELTEYDHGGQPSTLVSKK